MTNKIKKTRIKLLKRLWGDFGRKREAILIRHHFLLRHLIPPSVVPGEALFSGTLLAIFNSFSFISFSWLPLLLSPWLRAAYKPPNRKIKVAQNNKCLPVRSWALTGQAALLSLSFEYQNSLLLGRWKVARLITFWGVSFLTLTSWILPLIWAVCTCSVELFS